jgi:serine/threonine protein kinase
MGRGRCYWCGKRTRYGCKQCKEAWYCDETCQRADYTNHRLACIARNETDIGVQLEQMSAACESKIAFRMNARESKLWVPEVIKPEWKHIRTIGDGSFGTVEEYDVGDGRRVAVKFMKLDAFGCVTRSILNELRIRNISHPNVAATCGISHMKYPVFKTTASSAVISGFAGRACIAMVMEKATMDMFEYYDKSDVERGEMPSVLDPDDFAVLAYQAIRGIAELHDHAIIHADIKPDNLLVGNSMARDGTVAKRVIVADLGLSLEAHNDDMTNPSNGTSGYRAPEIVFANKHDPGHNTTFASDIWACGASLYEIATGKAWIDNEKRYEQLFKQLGSPVDDDLAWLKTFDKWNRRSHRYVGYDRNERLAKLTDLLKPYTGFYTVFREMMQFNPKNRPSAYALLKLPYFANMPRRSLGNATVEKYVEAKFPHVKLIPATGSASATTITVTTATDTTTTTTTESDNPSLQFLVKQHFPPVMVEKYQRLEPDPKWMVETLNELQLRISSGPARPPQATTGNSIKSIHFQTVLHLMSIANNDPDNDKYSTITLFKAIDLLNMLCGNVYALPVYKGVRGIGGYLADTLYMIARKSFTDSDEVAYYNTIPSATIEDVTSVYPLVEEFVLQSIDYDVWRPTVYDFAHWLTSAYAIRPNQGEMEFLWMVCLALSTDVGFLQGRRPSEIATIALRLTFNKRFPVDVGERELGYANAIWTKLKSNRNNRFGKMLASCSRSFSEWNHMYAITKSLLH